MFGDRGHTVRTDQACRNSVNPCPRPANSGRVRASLPTRTVGCAMRVGPWLAAVTAGLAVLSAARGDEASAAASIEKIQGAVVVREGKTGPVTQVFLNVTK